jgi:glycosyltransferase involved in cell wall biosynthesis
VRGFGARAGWIPRSGSLEGATLGLAESSGLLGFKPHAIVAYDALSPAAWLGARRARKLRVPLVLVEEAIAEAGRPFDRILRRLGDHLWGIFVRRTATRLVALDGTAREQALSRGFARDLVVDLDPGLALSTYRPGLASHLLSQHDIRGRVLLHVGALAVGRGVELLIRAFAATVGQRSDWSLVLCGEGTGCVELRALADRMGVGARVHWISNLREEELPGLIGASTLFAMPAQDTGPEGRVVRQALACGVPVLASRAHARLVEDDGAGLVAGADDVASWTHILRRAASSPEGRRRWGERARAIAEDRFAWPRIAATFERLLLDARAALASRLLAKGIPPGDLADVSLDADVSLEEGRSS